MVVHDFRKNIMRMLKDPGATFCHGPGIPIAEFQEVCCIISSTIAVPT